MKDIHINSIEEMTDFLQANQNISFAVPSQEDKYKLISKTLIEFRYNKLKKKYNSYRTPYEKLVSLDNLARYLKDGVMFEKLDKIAYTLSDNECANKMKKARELLFTSFKK